MVLTQYNSLDRNPLVEKLRFVDFFNGKFVRACLACWRIKPLSACSLCSIRNGVRICMNLQARRTSFPQNLSGRGKVTKKLKFQPPPPTSSYYPIPRIIFLYRLFYKSVGYPQSVWKTPAAGMRALTVGLEVSAGDFWGTRNAFLALATLFGCTRSWFWEYSQRVFGVPSRCFCCRK